jgi:hypothetical protein
MAIGRWAGARWVPALGIVAALMATAGIGFSAFGSSAAVHGTATAGSIDLVITEVSAVADPDPAGVYVHTSALPSPLVHAWINNTIASSNYNVSIVVENLGTVPADDFHFLTTVSTGGPSVCHIGATFTNSAIDAPASDSLVPGKPFTTYWTLHSAVFHASCGGDTYLGFSVTFTGTAGA